MEHITRWGSTGFFTFGVPGALRAQFFRHFSLEIPIFPRRASRADLEAGKSEGRFLNKGFF